MTGLYEYRVEFVSDEFDDEVFETPTPPSGADEEIREWYAPQEVKLIEYVGRVA